MVFGDGIFVQTRSSGRQYGMEPSLTWRIDGVTNVRDRSRSMTTSESREAFVRRGPLANESSAVSCTDASCRRTLTGEDGRLGWLCMRGG